MITFLGVHFKKPQPTKLNSAWGSDGFYSKLGFEASPTRINELSKILSSKERDLNSFKKYAKESHEYDEIIRELEADVADYRKAVNDPVGAGNPGGGQILFFTPTPENVAKLFSK